MGAIGTKNRKQDLEKVTSGKKKGRRKDNETFLGQPFSKKLEVRNRKVIRHIDGQKARKKKGAARIKCQLHVGVINEAKKGNGQRQEK